MSGELQTIPARHGVATFVPRGRTVKVINTYGRQVVSMWAFTLGAPPEDDDEGSLGMEEVGKEAKKLQEAADEVESNENAAKEGIEPADNERPGLAENEQSKQKSKEKALEMSTDDSNGESGSNKGDGLNEEHEDPPEQAPDTPDNEKSAKKAENPTKDADDLEEKAENQPSKRTWASYLPSIPYRSKGKEDKADKTGAAQEPSPEEQKAQNEANTKKWSSYIPTGKGFSSYIPNVEVPSKEGVVSAFKSSHYRDPNKSYAEQLYDFSKTPVGAGTIAAATGSGYASSVYAAYSAYAQTHPSNSSRPPMEYLSLPHTRASSYKLVPEVNDTLLTNLRNPIITLVEDTTPGAHDTLTAACDANLYAALGVEKPAEHGSCAENLVLALKELNENAGLKGVKAVGADISVNIAPTPLHLFMVTPIKLPLDDNATGSGAKGAKLTVEEPKGKKRSFVRFKAERDVVVVFSACPMDVGPQNGGRCMAANFMVEEAEVDHAASVKSNSEKKILAKKPNVPGKRNETETTEKTETKSAQTSEEKKQKMEKVKPETLSTSEEKEDKDAESKGNAATYDTQPQAKQVDKEPAAFEQKDKQADGSPAPKLEEKINDNGIGKGSDLQCEESVKPKKKPKKLQVRSKQ